MIYVSSSCVKSSLIKESIEKLHAHGFSNIELSGGTRPYAGLTDDLLSLKKEYGLQLLCHNYFPPPQENFVINLASLNDDVYTRSMNHAICALELSAKVGADKFAIHAGFLIDIPVNEMGKGVSNKQLFNVDEAKTKFVESLKLLLVKAKEHNIALYVENNVLSDLNFENFRKVNPFFLCTREDAEELFELVPGIKVLTDLAHLKVSSQTLGRNFKEDAEYFMGITDYVHLSDNDGLSDANQEITKGSEMWKLLEKMDLENKIITFEIYSGLDKVKETVDNINRLIYA